MSGRLFRPPAPERSARNAAPLTLPCGQLPLALAGALCGPAAARSVRESGSGPRARVVLGFEHSTVGRIELAVGRDDEDTHAAIRAARADAASFARLFAVLAVALELDGSPGAFTFEGVHRLTHGPRPSSVNRARLNAPVSDLLQVLAAAEVSWTPPRGESRKPRPPVALGALLSIDTVNRKARTVAVAPAARKLLTHYSLLVRPEAFLVAAQAAARTRPPAPVLARLRLAALIAARWRAGRRDEPPQRVAFGDVLARFAWVTLDAAHDGGGAAEAAGRVLRPRLREAVRVLASEVADPQRYGAGLLAEVDLRNRAALRSLLLLGIADREPQAVAAEVGETGVDEPVHQPTLEEARLRAVGTAPVFPPQHSIADGQDKTDDSIAHGQDEEADSIAHGQDDRPMHVIADGQDRAGLIAEGLRARGRDRQTTAAVEVNALGDGRVVLEFANGFGVLLPADVAATAGLHDWIADGQDRHQPRQEGSIADGHVLDRLRPGSPPDSIAGGQTSPSGFGSTAGISAPESSPDDSDRARGARLPAALAPPTIPDPPPQRASLARDPAQHRRTA